MSNHKSSSSSKIFPLLLIQWKLFRWGVEHLLVPILSIFLHSFHSLSDSNSWPFLLQNGISEFISYFLLISSSRLPPNRTYKNMRQEILCCNILLSLVAGLVGFYIYVRSYFDCLDTWISVYSFHIFSSCLILRSGELCPSNRNECSWRSTLILFQTLYYR